MRGFVPTPPRTVDEMVAQLFRHQQPTADSVVLDPGSGPGAFVDGIIRWCQASKCPLPKIISIESNPAHVAVLRQRFADYPSVRVVQEDFLSARLPAADFVIGNPPYVPITQLDEKEKSFYRATFSSASGRFDLYLLFFERSVKLLKPTGRLVFITPEKFLYVHTASAFRHFLAEKQVEEIRLVSEETFEGYVAYPAITTVNNRHTGARTRVMRRRGESLRVTLPADGASWLPHIMGASEDTAGPRLDDISLKIGCGVATGADSVFVHRQDGLDPELKRFAYPTIAGREISSTKKEVAPTRAMLLPYARDGKLLAETRLGSLGTFLSNPERKSQLLQRTCAERKPWYAFHETPSMSYFLRPKIVCKDIVARPFFVVEATGTVIPRHSVYYIVPKNPSHLHEIASYLNSAPAQRWLESHCHRAANGYFRLQSKILKKLPVPRRLLTDTGELAPA